MADRKRSKERETIDRSREEAELARIDALSDEELDREIRDAGIDPSAIDATLAAPLLWTPSDLPDPARPRPAWTKARRRVVLVALALAMAVAVACAIAWRRHAAHAPPLLEPAPPPAAAA